MRRHLLGGDDTLDAAGWHASFPREVDIVRAAAFSLVSFLGVGLGAKAIG